MSIVGRFFDLKPTDRIFVLKTFFYSYYIRLITWFLPFSRVQRLAEGIGKHQVRTPKMKAKEIVWAINVTDPYVLKSTCLTKAITAQMLLNQQDITSKLRIGVIKDENFEAHAWLEVDGQIIMGHSEREYVSLVDF
jgi:hypothetical protein